MAFRVLTTLQDPWWGKQPEETPDAFRRFERFLGQPDDDPDYDDIAGRSLQKLADSLRRDPRTIREQAKAQRWWERAGAYDEYVRAQRRARRDRKVEEGGNKIAQDQIEAAQEALHLFRMGIRQRISDSDAPELDELPRIADAAIKLEQAAQRAPEQARAIYRHAHTTGETTTGDASVWEVELPEFAGLSPAARQERVTELLSSMARLKSYQDREHGGGE